MLGIKLKHSDMKNCGFCSSNQMVCHGIFKNLLTIVRLFAWV